LAAGLVVFVIHAQTCGLWGSRSGKFIPPAPPFLLLLNNQLLFILLFDTFKFVSKFVSCHGGDTVYVVVVVGMEVAILVLRVLPQVGYCLAATSGDLLELKFLLFQ
jgi:hypothetical protein